MTRALAALALLALVAAPVAAHPIERDWWIVEHPHPVMASTTPTEPPPPPRQRWLGYRFGVVSLSLDGGDRVCGTFGLQYGLQLVRELRLFTDYELLIVYGSGDRDEKIRGRGHALHTGLRHPIIAGTLKQELRFYADAEASIGASYTTDDQLGTRLTPQAALGLRLGYEFLYRDDDTGRRRPRFDGHMVFRAVRTPTGTGLMFGVGMDWGS